MIGLGTIVNTIAIVAGGLGGLVSRRFLKERYQETVTKAIGFAIYLDELERLYESLQCALYDNGFSRERKRFRPHITLGRNVEHDELVMGELQQLAPNASMTVQAITLFESVRQEGKVVYRALHRERF